MLPLQQEVRPLHDGAYHERQVMHLQSDAHDLGHAPVRAIICDSRFLCIHSFMINEI